MTSLIKNLDDAQAEIYHMRVLTELVWELAGDINWSEVPTQVDVERLSSLTSVVADRARQIENDFDAFARAQRKADAPKAADGVLEIGSGILAVMERRKRRREQMEGKI